MSTDISKIKLNQNLWGIVVSLLGLGLAEFYCLKTLYWFAFIIAVASTASFMVSLIPYTINYWRNKFDDNEKKE